MAASGPTIDAAAKESRANAVEDVVTITSGAKEKVDRRLASVVGIVEKLAHPMDKEARKQADERAELRKADVSAQQAAIRQRAHQEAELKRLGARLEVGDILAQGQGGHRYAHPRPQPADAVAPAPDPAPPSVGGGGISAPSTNPPCRLPLPPRPMEAAISASPPHSGGGDAAISELPSHSAGGDPLIAVAPPHSGGGGEDVEMDKQRKLPNMEGPPAELHPQI